MLFACFYRPLTKQQFINITYQTYKNNYLPTRSLWGPTALEFQLNEYDDGQLVKPSWCLVTWTTYLRQPKNTLQWNSWRKTCKINKKTSLKLRGVYGLWRGVQLHGNMKTFFPVPTITAVNCLTAIFILLNFFATPTLVKILMTVSM